MTEVMSARVSARTSDGQTRIIADNVPGANGITAYKDRLFMDECRPGGRLFELFPDGRTPRLIADNLALPNALSVGPDEQIYFPQIAAGEIWRVPLSGGTPQRFIAGLAVPTAVKFDQKGVLTSTQAGNGESDQDRHPKRRKDDDQQSTTGDRQLCDRCGQPYIYLSLH